MTFLHIIICLFLHKAPHEPSWLVSQLELSSQTEPSHN